MGNLSKGLALLADAVAVKVVSAAAFGAPIKFNRHDFGREEERDKGGIHGFEVSPENLKQAAHNDIILGCRKIFHTDDHNLHPKWSQS